MRPAWFMRKPLVVFVPLQERYDFRVLIRTSCPASACPSGKGICSLRGVHLCLSPLRPSHCPRLTPPCRDSYGACVSPPTGLDRVCPFLFNLF
jgi:hypothetical protein